MLIFKSLKELTFLADVFSLCDNKGFDEVDEFNCFGLDDDIAL